MFSPEELPALRALMGWLVVNATEEIDHTIKPLEHAISELSGQTRSPMRQGLRQIAESDMPRRIRS